MFVSLHRHGDLRGCIGHVLGDAPLPDLVGDMAVAAASEDPRFPPVRPDELDGLAVEVSFLSAPEPARAEDVVPGEHGVLIRRGGRMGVFLPQVAPEQGWDRATLLAMLCRKAGLPPEALRDPATRLEVFRAQVVGEHRP